MENLLSLKDIIEQSKTNQEIVSGNNPIGQLLMIVIQRLQAVLKHLVVIGKKGLVILVINNSYKIIIVNKF